MEVDFPYHIHHYAIWLGNTSPEAMYFCEKAGLIPRKHLIANYPQQTKVLTGKKQNLFISEHGREGRDGGIRCIRDPSLGNLKTCIVHVVINESGSPDEVDNPPKRSRGQWWPGRDQRPVCIINMHTEPGTFRPLPRVYTLPGEAKFS